MNEQREDKTVFWDIGDTLASPRISGPPHRLVGLDVYPYVPAILQRLSQKGIRQGIISNTFQDDTVDSINSVLDDAGIYTIFDPNLLIYSSDPLVNLQKDSPEIFKMAANLAGHADSPQNCLFVSENPQERAFAIEAKFKVAPHPLLVEDELNERQLMYIRITTSVDKKDAWLKKLRLLPIVPLYVTGEGGNTVYAMASTHTALLLDDLGYYVDRLGTQGLPQTATLYLLRDDLQASAGFADSQGQSYAGFAENNETSIMILSSMEEGLIVALPAGYSVENFHFRSSYHGHNMKLMPDVALIHPFGTTTDTRSAEFLTFDGSDPELVEEELAALAEITPDLIRDHLERYTGVTTIDDDGEIASRHIFSPDNPRAIQSLIEDFHKIGQDELLVSSHQFLHEGHILENVEAELRGETDELVLVTAHMDSSAAKGPGLYNPVEDPAPGADDDASGMAAVLATARVIKKMSFLKEPKRTIRFVLFNAEEHGLVGSKAYARKQAMLNAPIVAVYQMDMIGYNNMLPRSWEIHAGYRASADVEQRSILLAERIKKLQDQVAPELEIPQIYSNSIYDPAAGRSDHASFHERGYAACLVSEDFFAGPAQSSPGQDPNPNYHMSSDILTHIDLDYAVDITRLVAAAVWVTANI